MDKTVDSFLKEINEMAAPPTKNVWKECFDEHSGFTYYWNTQTDDVTWTVPEGYKKSADHKTTKKPLYIPPPSEEKLMLGSIPRVNRDTVKIYKLDDVAKLNSLPSNNKNKQENSVKTSRYAKRHSSDSEDEKIVLISSYGTESSSSDEEPKVQINNDNTKKVQEITDTNTQEKIIKSDNSVQKSTSPYNSEDETDILSRIQNKAKVLKQLGGEIPESVKSLVSDTTTDNTKKELTGFSLVAGYGTDTDDDSEQEEHLPHKQKHLFPIPQDTEEKEVINILFPITKAPDISQFCDVTPIDKPDTTSPKDENVDVKAFQRKRRIGVSLLNVQKKPQSSQKTENENKTPDSERPGFGFKGGTNKEYLGFKSAGVLFTKSEEGPQTPENHNGDFDTKNDENLLREIDEFHGTLNEKLKFLCEGHSPALPVQLMIIQMETLYTAMLEKCLKPSYLKRWLDNTCDDLCELEKDAAPGGWLLQWDRTHKRYYYHNQTTGENQWQYPQPDIVSVDEAMDISTTPPPPVVSDDEQPPPPSMNLILPPPPPQIKEKSISPPPPPIISDYKLKENMDNGEPFPPGVDEIEIIIKPIGSPKQQPPHNDSFTSELNSFYSDIATIENVQCTSTSEGQTSESITFKENAQIENVIPIKKKKKAKMGQGLAMKKKGVSKLVEKWKNVQKGYN